MKLLHLDSRSILPRVDFLHLTARFIVVAGIVAFLFFGDYSDKNLYPILIILAVELIVGAGSWFISRNYRKVFALLYLTAILIDVVLLTALTHYTGGVGSQFTLFYLLSVALGAYIMSPAGTLMFCGFITGCYVFGNYDTLGAYNPLHLTIRVVFFWFYAAIINYVSEYIRRSESRLLKLFNTLNRRTSELEKIHAQLEMVYENSRVLGGILDYDQIPNEILKIGEKVLDYPALGIMLTNQNRELVYHGRLIGSQANTLLKPVDQTKCELAYRVFQGAESVRVIDLTTRADYDPLLKQAQSVMLVPMVTHGRVTGLLVAESPRKGAFEERDEEFLSVLARSAAMAIENASLHRQMEELTIIDELTGVRNFRFFSEKIEEEKKRAVRYNQPLSLIMLDIDWFKKFNDNYGHEVGNQVLVHLVEVIQLYIRDVDILCRYGGEEFIVILPLTSEREALVIANRIRVEVELALFNGNADLPDLKVTVSVGVSSFPENGLNEKELINAVDQAMYRAKGSGKNRVCTV